MHSAIHPHRAIRHRYATAVCTIARHIARLRARPASQRRAHMPIWRRPGSPPSPAPAPSPEPVPWPPVLPYDVMHRGPARPRATDHRAPEDSGAPPTRTAPCPRTPTSPGLAAQVLSEVVGPALNPKPKTLRPGTGAEPVPCADGKLQVAVCGPGRRSGDAPEWQPPLLIPTTTLLHPPPPLAAIASPPPHQAPGGPASRRPQRGPRCCSLSGSRPACRPRSCRHPSGFCHRAWRRRCTCCI